MPFRGRAGYILLAIVIKLVALFLFAQERAKGSGEEGALYTMTGDAVQYVGMAENLLKYGEYRTEEGDFAKRMPGYAPIYLALRFFLSQHDALHVLLAVQAVLSGVSCYVLALVALRITRSERIFHFVFWAYAISTYVSIWDGYLITESLSASLLIFSFWFLLRGRDHQLGIDHLASGALFAWCIFLRPFLIPFLPVYALAVLFQDNGRGGRLSWGNALLFVLPFLLADGAWLARNKLVMHRWLPLQTSADQGGNGPFSIEDPLRNSVSSLTRSLGIDHASWNPNEATYWFLHADGRLVDRTLLKKLLNNGRTFGDIEALREKCVAVAQQGDTALAVQAMKKSAILEMKALHDDYKAAHPLHYWIGARLVHWKRFMLHSGVYNIPFPPYAEQDLLQKAVKAFYAVLYGFGMVFGALVCGVLFLVRLYRVGLLTCILALPLFIMFLFPILLEAHEYRFNVLCYPFFLVCACWAVHCGLSWAQHRISTR
jgi:hypothetical protein